MNIILDIAVNLVASFVWWLLFVLSGGRKKIDYLVTVAINCARQFESTIEYNDFDTTCRQADRLIDLMLNIEDAIRPFTYLKSKKKLIRTYIYSVFYTLTILMNSTAKI